MDEEQLLAKPLGSLTLGQFFDAWNREQKDQVALTRTLRDLSKALDRMETVIPNEKTDQVEALKQLRETFNRISPKWFHT